MEQLDIVELKTNICFKINDELNEKLVNLLKEKNWRKSAFIRVAIAKEIQRIENENNDK